MLPIDTGLRADESAITLIFMLSDTTITFGPTAAQVWVLLVENARAALL